MNSRVIIIMKLFINRLFIFAFTVIVFAFSAHAEDYPKLRVAAIDASNYKDQYSSALKSDPYEGFNRAMFSFNDTLDSSFLEPVSRFYKSNLPRWGRNRVSSFFNNLGEINNFLNSIFQGDIESVFRSFTRFGINSTFGIAGLHDVAGGFGLKEKEKTFSQTLALYGVGSGNYLVLPFLGPSTSRDFASNVFSKASDPTSYISNGYVSAAFGLVDLVDVRSDLLDLTDEIKLTSFDPYSTYKSSYLQHQRNNFLKTIE